MSGSQNYQDYTPIDPSVYDNTAAYENSAYGTPTPGYSYMAPPTSQDTSYDHSEQAYTNAPYNQYNNHGYKGYSQDGSSYKQY